MDYCHQRGGIRMRTVKIKVKTLDRPITTLSAMFDSIVGSRKIDRHSFGVWSTMVKFTDKVYAMVRRKYRISDDWFIEVTSKYIYCDKA